MEPQFLATGNFVAAMALLVRGTDTTILAANAGQPNPFLGNSKTGWQAWPLTPADFVADDGLVSTGGAALFLVSEPDGERTLGCRIQCDEARDWPDSRCRAFLLEPELVERLKPLTAGRPWQQAFSPETVANDFEVARFLSAVPELKGEIRNGEVVLERAAVPERYDTFPPRTELPRVLIIYESLGASQTSGKSEV